MTGKTPVCALHEFMNKWHAQPVYECLSKFGKSHKPYYRFRCKAMGEEVIGTGRSKVDAKRIVATMILEQLSLRGYKVSKEFEGIKAIHQLMDDAGLPTHSFVVLVNELCSQYRLDRVEYEILADAAAGTYTVHARIGQVVREGQGPSKRVAQQLAAEQIYKHLRTRLKGTRNFNENEAMYRAYEKAMAPTAEEEVAAEQRRKEEEESAAAAACLKAKKKKKKKPMRLFDLDETMRMELDISESGSHDVGPGPSASAPDDLDDEGATAAPNGIQDHDFAMRFISSTMARLGL